MVWQPFVLAVGWEPPWWSNGKAAESQQLVK